MSTEVAVIPADESKTIRASDSRPCRTGGTATLRARLRSSAKSARRHPQEFVDEVELDLARLVTYTAADHELPKNYKRREDLIREWNSLPTMRQEKTPVSPADSAQSWLPSLGRITG